MPTTYTHYRFGEQCIDVLPARFQESVNCHRSLYDFGVHGPDLFFYYRPVWPNRVSKYGSRLHRLPARGFFERSREAMRDYGDRNAMAAYLLGYLSHFALDSACHGYVEEARRKLGITHNRLEACFDARLMKEDSLTPSGVNRGFSLHPSPQGARIIARFFDLPAKTVLAAQKGQVAVMNLLYSPSGRKKRLLRRIIRLLHIPGSFDDLFLDDEIPGEYEEAMEELDRLFRAALEEYAQMAESLVEFWRGRGELSPRFDRDFE